MSLNIMADGIGCCYVHRQEPCQPTVTATAVHPSHLCSTAVQQQHAGLAWLPLAQLWDLLFILHTYLKQLYI
jgi:hypothetical protein